MLITLLIWLLIFILGWAYGRISLRLLESFLGASRTTIPLVFTWVLGLCSMTLIADVFSLFAPINALFFAVITAGALVCLWFEFRSGFKMPAWPRWTFLQWSVVGIGCLIFFTILDFSSRAAANADTAIYHAQTIRWMETYRVVPGLGNLHSRLAYNSNWLMSNAFFSLTWVTGEPFHALPGVLVVMSILYFWSGAWDLVNSRGNPVSFLKLFLIPMFFIVLPSEVSSPGTDLPAVLLTWLILSELTSQLWNNFKFQVVPMTVLGILCIFAVTIKLSVFPLAIIPMVIFIRTWRSGQKALVTKQILLWGATLLPWLIRNVIISGYLVYPLSQINLFPFDWKIPPAEALSEVITIRNWARHSYSEALKQVVSLPFQEWVPLWFRKETLNHRIMAVIVLCGMIAYPLGAWIGRKKLLNHPLYSSLILVYLASFLGCIFWFFSAPDFRFGSSFIIFSLGLILFPLFILLMRIKARYNWLNAVLLVCFLIFQCGFYGLSFESKTLPERLVKPVPYMTTPTSRCQFNNFTVFCAELYNQCWYEPFPCVPRAIPDVEKRGSSYEDGFRDKTLNR